MLYGYTRVSTAEQANGGSLAEQTRCIEGVALLRGMPVENVFVDAGVSGAKKLDQRPGGKTLLDTVQPGDVVVVSKLDRFARNALDALERAEAFKTNGVELIIIDLGTEPVTSNGVAKLFFTILAGIADEARDQEQSGTACVLIQGRPMSFNITITPTARGDCVRIELEHELTAASKPSRKRKKGRFWT